MRMCVSRLKQKYKIRHLVAFDEVLLKLLQLFLFHVYANEQKSGLYVSPKTSDTNLQLIQQQPRHKVISFGKLSFHWSYSIKYLYLPSFLPFINDLNTQAKFILMQTQNIKTLLYSFRLTWWFIPHAVFWSFKYIKPQHCWILQYDGPTAAITCVDMFTNPFSLHNGPYTLCSIV